MSVYLANKFFWILYCLCFVFKSSMLYAEKYGAAELVKPWVSRSFIKNSGRFML